MTTSGSLIEYNVQWLYMTCALVLVSEYGGPGRLVTDNKYAHVPVVSTVATGGEYICTEATGGEYGDHRW